MRISVSKLRRIIKEEVAQRQIREAKQKQKPTSKKSAVKKSAAKFTDDQLYDAIEGWLDLGFDFVTDTTAEMSWPTWRAFASKIYRGTKRAWEQGDVETQDQWDAVRDLSDELATKKPAEKALIWDVVSKFVDEEDM